MELNIDKLDKLYKQYGFRIVKSHENVRLYLYEEGRYYGADIVPLNDVLATLQICKEIKTEYAEGGYAVQLREYEDNEAAATELYKSFFSYEATTKRIKNKYNDFVKSQSKLNGGFKYKYINAPYQINAGALEYDNIISTIKSLLSRESPQLIIVEAAAGYGKTCTAYEILNSLLNSDFCENPLLTELSRNRGVDKFRYILLDEIDREYHTLDYRLVNYEIQTGRIPLIIDGFDELLYKSDMVKSEKNEVFKEVETMLDTIGSLLKEHAKIVLTTRKTAIFAGEEFNTWLKKWNNSFDVTRVAIEVPRIKDWLGDKRLNAIKEFEIPVEYIANPVLLTYLRNLEDPVFQTHLNEPDTIVKRYFYSLLKREIERQELRISPEDQYLIFKNVVRMLIEFDQSTHHPSFFKEIIIDQNRELLEKTVALYSGNKTIELIADKLITHALLDRRGQERIGFINDFVFGTFIGEIMSETSVKNIEKYFSAYMVEIGATAYRVQTTANKSSLWEKINALHYKFENSTLFNFDVTLQGKLLRNYHQTIFHSISVFKVNFDDTHSISSSVFINCKFKRCDFWIEAFESVSFIECYFEDCKANKHLDDGSNITTIKCFQKNSKLLYYNSYTEHKAGDILVEELEENRLLAELYQLEEIFKSQRLIHLMKRYAKHEHKLVARTIDSLVTKKIVSVSGLDIFIEMNKLSEVEKRIGKKTTK